MWVAGGEFPGGFSQVIEEGILAQFQSLIFNFFKQNFLPLELFKISNIKHSLQGILVEGIKSLLSQRKKEMILN